MSMISDTDRKTLARVARGRISQGQDYLRYSLEGIATEEENPEAIRVQNALDLVETALYWLEGYDD